MCTHATRLQACLPREKERTVCPISEKEMGGKKAGKQELMAIMQMPSCVRSTKKLNKWYHKRAANVPKSALLHCPTRGRVRTYTAPTSCRPGTAHHTGNTVSKKVNRQISQTVLPRAHLFLHVVLQNRNASLPEVIREPSSDCSAPYPATSGCCISGSPQSTSKVVYVP